MTSFNEDLLKYDEHNFPLNELNSNLFFRFLQDEQQRQLKIFDMQEYDKILELAKLYSLNIAREDGYIVLNKTW